MKFKTLGKQQKNPRGFRYIQFEDIYKSKCSIQESSIWLDNNLGGKSALWIGIGYPSVRIMVKDAIKLGIPTKETCGWIDYKFPEEVVISSRMHLNRKQIKSLVGHLSN